MREITEYADVSERTVRGWIHAPIDALPAVRVGGKILVKRSELDAWLGRRRVTPLERIDIDGIVKDVLQAASNGR
jgi:excisionase family DNA binding protein